MHTYQVLVVCVMCWRVSQCCASAVYLSMNLPQDSLAAFGVFTRRIKYHRSCLHDLDISGQIDRYSWCVRSTSVAHVARWEPQNLHDLP